MPTTFCRHIRLNGERCNSRALANKAFCFYHAELERRHRRCSARRNADPAVLHPMSLQDGSQRDPVLLEPAEPSFDFPPLEDRHAIQVALSLVITALAENRIDPKRAALLFYGLQVASGNARLLNPIPKRDPGKVSKTILDDATDTLIAPDEDPEDPGETQDWERPGTATRYWQMLQAEERESDILKAEAQAKATADAVAIAVAEALAAVNDGGSPLPPPL